MAGLLTIVPVGAMILSGSRAGIVCLAFEVAVLALLARTRKGLRGATIIAVAFVGMASVALIAWLGAGKAIERFSKTRIGDVTLSRRTSMSRGAAHIFLDHPLKGVGLGTIITVFPAYDTGYDGRIVTTFTMIISRDSLKQGF
jgi:O-antigen ligase